MIVIVHKIISVSLKMRPCNQGSQEIRNALAMRFTGNNSGVNMQVLQKLYNLFHMKHQQY